MIRKVLGIVARDFVRTIFSRWFLVAFFTAVAAYDFVHAVAADTLWGALYFATLMLIALIAAAQQMREVVLDQQIKLIRETINYINERRI